MLQKQELIQLITWEMSTTARVMRAVGQGQLLFRPSEKSGTTQDLFRVIISEVATMQGFLIGNSKTEEAGGIVVESIAQGVEQFEQSYRQLITALQASDEEILITPIIFFGHDTIRAGAIFKMLLDIIHHRGQLTVYIRITQGHVPSIYGPSGDEEMRR